MTKFVIPAVRALIAIQLVRKYNMTQVEAARKLGVTQPAISYYLNSKRGKIVIEKIRKNKEIMELIEKLAELVYQEEPPEEIQKVMCEICAKVKKSKGLTE